MQITEQGPNGITRGMAATPRNAWYVAAGSVEIGDKLLARRILDTPVVLFRTAAGEAVALLDRCPHRLMPLSLGTRIGDEIQCLYHGIQFAASGKCTLIPSQKPIPKVMCVRRFPLVEKGPFAWIWVGDEAAMDPTLIPDPGRVQPHYSQFFNVCLPIKADFLLMLENLMDTSHPTFLHAGYFDDGQLAGAPTTLEVEGNRVRLIRDIGIHVPGPGTTAWFRLDPGKRVHQVTITETYAPSLNVIVYQFTYPDEPQRPMQEFIALAPITPSSQRECYHFVATCTSWPEQGSTQMNDGVAAVIAGDQLALEAIELRRDDLGPEETEVHIRADSASLALRRMIVSMAEKERAVITAQRDRQSA